jgi:N-formylglutamate amidohydrolase
MQQFATFTRGDGPVVAAALHAGHELRPGLLTVCALTDAERLREEDPFTAEWTECAGTRIVVHRSRFEVDANRLRASAVYRTPEDAWGLDLWCTPLSAVQVAGSLAEYDAFYAAVAELLDDRVARYGGFVLLDIHSYNHRRGGPVAPCEDPAGNPEVNLGTGSMDRARWAPVVEDFLGGLSSEGYDVRENVKFRGGNFASWVHGRYPTGCVLAVEFKKTWMDEWTGEPDAAAHARIASTLRRVVPRLANEFERVSL